MPSLYLARHSPRVASDRGAVGAGPAAGLPSAGCPVNLPRDRLCGPVRERAHVAYRVDSIEEASRGMKVLLEPFQPLENLRVGFFESADGAVVEFMEYDGDPL